MLYFCKFIINKYVYFGLKKKEFQIKNRQIFNYFFYNKFFLLS